MFDFVVEAQSTLLTVRAEVVLGDCNSLWSDRETENKINVVFLTLFPHEMVRERL